MIIIYIYITFLKLSRVACYIDILVSYYMMIKKTKKKQNKKETRFSLLLVCFQCILKNRSYYKSYIYTHRKDILLKFLAEVFEF